MSKSLLKNDFAVQRNKPVFQAFCLRFAKPLLPIYLYRIANRSEMRYEDHMPNPIKLKPHLTAEDLYQRYRKCQQPREKIRWRALYLIANGEVANDVAK